MKNVSAIVIHYSATERGRHVTVDEIDQWHRARGFRKIGYHYVIYLDGSIHKGRAETEVGAHVAGRNTGTIGICWIGGTERGEPNKGVDTRTPAQTAALTKLIRELLGRYPGAKVVGHRDLGATQCPGFDVGAWWASVNGAQAPVAAPVAPTAPVRTPDISEDRVHTVVAGETWFSIARMHGLSLADIFALNGTNAGHAIHPGEKLRVFAGSPAPAPVIPRTYPPLTATPAPAAPVGFWAWVRSWFRA
jgi:N-acetylmuramoyl-L-alanine amidase